MFTKLKHSIFIGLLLVTSSLFAQPLTSTIVVDRGNEVLFKLQDSGGDYTGFWTMNDGEGNMAIKLGVDGNGNYVNTTDGAAELLYGAHNSDGYISLNAAKVSPTGGAVNYGISLIVNSENNSIQVGAPNNNNGGGSTTGYKVINASGDLISNKLKHRSSAGLDIDLGSSGGDLSIYDAAGTEYVLGDQSSGDATGITLRTLDNPVSGSPLFLVESEGHSERLRVEHDGALSTTNYLEVENTGKSYMKGSLAISGTNVPSGYKLSVDGKAILEEVNVELSQAWPDYVFESGYDLKPLEEVQEYIAINKRLPNIPSAQEVEKNGILLGQMNSKLLEKIEELTLYTIDLNQQNIELKEQLETVMLKLLELEKKLAE
ncbi:MAG: hypothetical protein NXI20_18270 [bacterium]|nr:hypothetical protein [bacterium]